MSVSRDAGSAFCSRVSDPDSRQVDFAPALQHSIPNALRRPSRHARLRLTQAGRRSHIRTKVIMVPASPAVERGPRTYARSRNSSRRSDPLNELRLPMSSPRTPTSSSSVGDRTIDGRPRSRRPLRPAAPGLRGTWFRPSRSACGGRAPFRLSPRCRGWSRGARKWPPAPRRASPQSAGCHAEGCGRSPRCVRSPRWL